METNHNQSKPIIVAITANTAIAIAKGVGYLFSGSSALLSETIHSFADVMNQALLYIGIKRGKKGETEEFHYGHSQERFFWNLVSAMGIFVLGCGVTVYHGIHDLLAESHHQPPVLEQYIIEAILLISMLAESYSFYVATKEIKTQALARGKKFFEYLEESLDPSVSAVFWEDAAAILGILLAFTGILLSTLTGNKVFDASASIIIGLLMGWIAYHLAIENKKFLLDRSIPEFELNQLLEVLQKNTMILKYSDIKTVVLGPDRLKFTAKIELDLKKLSEKKISEITEQISKKDFIADPSQVRKQIESYTEKISDSMEEELMKIENALKAKLPNLKHVELTIH